MPFPRKWNESKLNEIQLWQRGNWEWDFFFGTEEVVIKHTLLSSLLWIWSVKARCHTRFQHAFTACCCVFKETTLVASNQRNYLENACSKRTLKTRVATRLNWLRAEKLTKIIFHLKSFFRKKTPSFFIWLLYW